MKKYFHLIVYPIRILLDGLMIFPLIIICLVSRFYQKKIDVGLGPEPLINNVYHKMALERYGYTAETFVSDVYFITDKFDIRGDKIFTSRYAFTKKPLLYLSYLYLFLMSVFRYKCLYIYFNGGPLSLGTSILWRVEPFLYKLANVKILVMPYGGDVQDMSRSPHLLFKHAMTHDYPEHRLRRKRIVSKIDLWTRYADHVISGCEWVYYMYHWDTLMLAHFSIDIDVWKPESNVDLQSPSDQFRKIRVLHAPNHRFIKGTQYFLNAVEELVAEGLEIEFVVLEKVSNEEIKRVMASVDIVADQLIVGWYAMFAIEAMAMEKPVLCFLSEALKELYTVAGLITPDEIPIINCTPLTVKEKMRELVTNRGRLPEIGKRSRQYVLKHHSTEAIGRIFDQINRSLGLENEKRIMTQTM